MFKNKKTIHIILISSCILCLTIISKAQCNDKANTKEIKRGTEISVCNLYLSKDNKKANLNFSISYLFSTDADGKPTNIKKIRDNYVGLKEVSSCIENWYIPGFKKDEALVATFVWEHAVGWKLITLISVESEFALKIRINDGIGY